GLMASQNAGALLTGMTDGVVNMWKFGLQQQRYDREDERQAKRDAREEAESGIRTEAAQMTLEKARREQDMQRYASVGQQLYRSGEDVPDFDTWRASQATASKPAAPVASAAAAAVPAAPVSPSAELPLLKSATPASTATSMPAPSKTDASVPNPFADTAPTVAPQAAPAPATAPATAQQADKPTPSIGDVIAAKGMKQQRTEDDVIKWLANFQRSQGLHDKASETETKWFELTEKRRAREKALLLENALTGINQGGGEWVAQNMGPLFGPDVQLRHAPDGNGGGVITAYKASDPTKPIGTQRYKDESDLYDMTERYIDPTGYAKRVAEAKAAEAKFKREMQLRTASRGLVLDANSDPAYYIDKPGNGRGNGSGSGDGTGTRSDKPPKTKADIASDMYMKAIEAAGQNTPLTAEQNAAGNTAARSAMQLNPGIDPSIAAQAGVLFAQAEPGKTSFRLDASTMTALEGVQTPGGWVAVNQVNHRNAVSRGMPPEQIKAAVESSIQQLTGGNPAQRQMVIAAATDKTGKARRALLEQAKAELKAMPEFKRLPPQVQVQKLAEHERIVNDMLATPLGWISNFGQELNK
ncbi:MAG: hypothetical protein ACMV1D_10565, partial [Macromonas sp.]